MGSRRRIPTRRAGALSSPLYAGGGDYWETTGPRYEALAPQDMDAAARRILEHDDYVWVVVGDAAVVEPQLGLPEVRAAQ